MTGQFCQMKSVLRFFVPWWRGSEVVTEAMDEKKEEEKTKEIHQFVGIKCSIGHNQGKWVKKGAREEDLIIIMNADMKEQHCST